MAGSADAEARPVGLCGAAGESPVALLIRAEARSSAVALDADEQRTAALFDQRQQMSSCEYVYVWKFAQKDGSQTWTGMHLMNVLEAVLVCALVLLTALLM